MHVMLSSHKGNQPCRMRVQNYVGQLSIAAAAAVLTLQGKKPPTDAESRTTFKVVQTVLNSSLTRKSLLHASRLVLVC